MRTNVNIPMLWAGAVGVALIASISIGAVSSLKHEHERIVGEQIHDQVQVLLTNLDAPDHWSVDFHQGTLSTHETSYANLVFNGETAGQLTVLKDHYGVRWIKMIVPATSESLIVKEGQCIPHGEANYCGIFSSAEWRQAFADALDFAQQRGVTL